jgi:hypothetical protein
MRQRLLALPIVLAMFGIAAYAASAAGDWRVTITTAGGSMTGKASLKVIGDKVSGWIGPSEEDPIPVDGTVKGSHVTLRTHPQDGRDAAFAQCDLTLKGDRMIGTLDAGKGTIELVRAPSK